MSTEHPAIIVYTHNMGESLTFYNELGLEFVRERHGKGPVHYSCFLGKVIFELYPRKPGSSRESEPSYGQVRLMIPVSNYVAVHTSMVKQRRVKSATPNCGDGTPRSTLVDPSNILVYIVPK